MIKLVTILTLFHLVSARFFYNQVGKFGVARPIN